MLLIALLALLGCDDSTPPVPASALPAPTFGNATITGHVRFVGTAPERKMIDVSTCQDGTKAYQEETIIVSPDGGLKDVVVSLKDAPASTGSDSPEVSFDQVGCRFVPHVVAVQVGQPLKITTSDAAFHNVHWLSGVNGDFNEGFTRVGQTKTVKLERPEFMGVRCDVHPWMRASIAVIPSPFFSVSAADGSFMINRVPAGKYMIAAWHPILGERTASVEVGSDGNIETDIDFAPPKP